MSRSCLVCGILIFCAGQPAPKAQTRALAIVEETLGAAEGSLRDGELQVAESRYRSALQQGWMLLGGLAAA